MTAENQDIWADAQPTDIIPPKEFRPTWRQPVPGMQCVALTRHGPNTGERCNARALLGASVCIAHGGHLPVVRKKAQAILEAARLKLIDNTDVAVDTLVDMMRTANSEAVRVKAATEVLDRAGVRGGIEVDVTARGDDPAELLRAKLDKLHERVGARVAIEGESEVVDEHVIVIEGASPEPSEE